MDLQADVGLLILAGVHRSSKEAPASSWHAESGRAVSRPAMTHEMFHHISSDLTKTPEQIVVHQLAPIGDVWVERLSLLPLMSDPGSDVIGRAPGPLQRSLSIQTVHPE